MPNQFAFRSVDDWTADYSAVQFENVGNSPGSWATERARSTTIPTSLHKQFAADETTRSLALMTSFMVLLPALSAALPASAIAALRKSCGSWCMARSPGKRRRSEQAPFAEESGGNRLRNVLPQRDRAGVGKCGRERLDQNGPSEGLPEQLTKRRATELRRAHSLCISGPAGNSEFDGIFPLLEG